MVLLSVMVPAYWAKGSSGPGVAIGAIVESAQATQASQVEADIVAEDVTAENALADVTTEEALADVINEPVAAEELLATDSLD